MRGDCGLPELGELDVMRHFVNLSHLNYGIETGFYPLGSCTMKYNPRVNEVTASMAGFARLHPMQPAETVPGAMELLMRVQDMLAEITGFSEITLQPLAGAHGEMTCLMLVKKFHDSRGEGTTKPRHYSELGPRHQSGFGGALRIRRGHGRHGQGRQHGYGDLTGVLAKHGAQIAALMLTNPSTLGLFEPNIERICAMVHEVGGQVFCDGANMNAMAGHDRPGDHGFDCMHLNLHKTFSTPHGGGGPGCGAIGLKHHLEPFLPVPVLRREGGSVKADYERPESIGRVSAFYGQFLMEVRAYTYLLAFGKEHMSDISRHAVLNANYVRERIKDVLPPAHDRPCMHEVVVTAERYKKEHGIRALDISKRLIDYGFHPPTNYFPLIVPECLMIEPTETETKETLDAFVAALEKIVAEAHADPEIVKSAPHDMPVRRLDEVKAARELVLSDRTPA